jgi:hypothetical protein
MRLDALHRLLREQDAISARFSQLIAGTDTLNAQLAMPRIAALQ